VMHEIEMLVTPLQQLVTKIRLTSVKQTERSC